MKKIILPVALVAATGAGIFVGVNQPRPDKAFSDLEAANIEAITEWEIIVKYAKNCLSYKDEICCTGPQNVYDNAIDYDDLDPKPNV